MVEGSFDWRSYVAKPNFVAAPVSCFKHVALSRSWDSIVPGILVEVRSPDCSKTSCPTTPCCYWIAGIVKVSGYLGLLRYEGFESDTSQDIWLNLCSNNSIHPIGWCAENGMPLVPPKCIEDKHTDWKEYLVRRISRARTIPTDFAFKVEEHKHTTIKKGMRVEVIDKNLISAIRPATVTEVVGGRLCIQYDDSETDEGFWCHEKSPLIHPVGWAQIVGHALKASPEYAMNSLRKTLFRTFDSNDATWDMFSSTPNVINNLKFKEGMKLETIDPLNLSLICVATVNQVLRNNYLMIGIDVINSTNTSESFCYHASSPYIFPVGFCESNSIELTPPKGYKGEFSWQDYLKKTKSKPAPYALFQREIPNHGFVEGMFLEAVDLMEPRLICIASVTKVIGSLIRIHFEGWEEAYDEWCDCESPDLFPVGWCECLSYRLEPPRSFCIEDNKKTRKPGPAKLKRGRRRLSQKKKNEESFEGVLIKKEPPEDSGLYSGAARMTLEDSSSASP